MATSPPRRVFGFWICLALVVGNMIGSGVYLLPASLAPFGWAGVFGWVFTIGGALCLAIVFGRLSAAFPKAGGPYAYSREAFGSFAGFLVAWMYWVSLWIGNVAIATGVVAPLGTIFPAVSAHSAWWTLGILWLLTAVNCLGARLAGGLQVAVTALKFLPLAAVILLAALVLGREGTAVLPPLEGEHLQFTGAGGIGAAAALTLWSFLGLESATIPAERVENPRKVIARATVAGTAVTGLVYLLSCSAVALMLPPEQASRSGAPLADFVALHWGAGAGTILALFAATTAFGALNGWILLQGEMPWAMAKDGVLPRWLAVLSPRGTPVRAYLVSSLLITAVLLFNTGRTATDLFTFLILLATTASLVAYFVCSLAALALPARGRMASDWLLAAAAGLGAAYSAWAMWGAGLEANGWGLALAATGLPVYLLTRRNQPDDRAVEGAPSAPERESDG
ncbi:MAG TPA: amino acid permease [Allosphingosinicella sp.]|jgi:APA family basic amino acid/polyamine antiporter